MKKNKVISAVTASVLAIALMFGTATTASANPIYDYALRVLNSRIECENTLKRIRHTLRWGYCQTTLVGVTFLVGVRK
jgi:hypothetical protein